MGVEVRAFLIPRENAFRPNAEALAGFVERLRANDWIADPTKAWFPKMTFGATRLHVHAKKTGAYVETPATTVDRVKRRMGVQPFPMQKIAAWLAERAETDLMIVWPIENQGDEPAPLRYPLSKPSPLAPDETYYDVEIWLARDYVYKITETIDGFDDESCSCGASLVDDPEATEGELFYTPRMRTRCAHCGKPFDASQRTARVRDPWTNAPSKLRGGATFRFALVIDCGKCWPEEGGFGIHPELRQLCEAHFQQSFYEVIEVY